MLADEFNLKDQRAAMAAIYDERRKVGMSLSDMEQKSGVSTNSFYAWRKEQRSPALVNAVAIAETFGFEIVMRCGDRELNLSNQREAMTGLDAELRNRGLPPLAGSCKASGIAMNSAYAWLSCARSPTISTLVRLADNFGFQIVMRRKK